MTYEPLHQKYRPQTFADLVGQSAIADTLSNAIYRQRIAPAYLFSGPRGTGKTSSARILAKSLNCISSDQPTAQPCGQCEVCRSIANSSALDIIEIDAASNTGVDNIREIIERSSFAPVQCRYKLYVIDECLSGDSLIQTSQGLIRIDDPNLVGKQVLTYNDTQGIWEYQTVLRWLNQGVKPTFQLTTTHHEIHCTENHLIYSDQGWIKAKHLQPGNKILSPTQWEIVESKRDLNQKPVYDLEVEHNHNFVANGLLVHNCHMLSTAAFNALLKTLEEPPPRVVFVLATTDPQRVLPTIISRCQRFDFQRIPLSAMVSHLQYIATKEAIEITEEALAAIAQVSHGGLRDAQSLLDQLSLLSGTITIERVWDLVGAIPEQDLITLLKAIKQGNANEILSLCRKLMDRGREPIIVLENLAGFYRDLLIAKTAPQQSELVALTRSTWEQLCEIAQQWQLADILRGQQHLQQSEAQIKHTTQPRLWLEVTLLGLLNLDQPTATAAETKVIATPPQPVQKSESQPITPSPVATTDKEESKKPVSPSPVESETVEEVAPQETAAIWEQMLENLPPPTKPLVKDHCRLLGIEGNVAQVGVRNKQLERYAKKRQHDLENALQAILHKEIKVNLQVGGADKIVQSIPEEKPPVSSPTPTLPKKKEKPSQENEQNGNGHHSPVSPPVEEKTEEESPPETDSPSVTEDKTLEQVAKDFASAFKGEVVRFGSEEFAFLNQIDGDAAENEADNENNSPNLND